MDMGWTSTTRKWKHLSMSLEVSHSFLTYQHPSSNCLLIDNATLIFDDSQDLQLNVEYILVINGSRLQIGTESQPFQHRAEINLYGDQLSTELPICMCHLLLFSPYSRFFDLDGAKSLGDSWRNSWHAWNITCANMDTIANDSHRQWHHHFHNGWSIQSTRMWTTTYSQHFIRWLDIDSEWTIEIQPSWSHSTTQHKHRSRFVPKWIFYLTTSSFEVRLLYSIHRWFTCLFA